MSRMGIKDPVTATIVRLPDALTLLGGISKPTAYRLVKSGQLTLVKIASRTFITKASIEAVLENGTGPPRPAPRMGRGEA
jgi:hypothetical protein